MGRKDLLQKHGILVDAGETLKGEFVGLNEVIDRIVESSTGWFLFPELQSRPLIINLWGMTGTGKTSLARRFAELTGFEKRFYSVDLGKSGRNGDISRTLDTMFTHHNGEQTIIALDEFQHARTLDSSGDEIPNTFSQSVWQLLDTGKFYMDHVGVDVDDIYELQIFFNSLKKQGVILKNGRPVRGKKIYYRRLNKLNYFRMFADPDQDDPEIPDEYFTELEKAYKVLGRFEDYDEIALRKQSVENWLKLLRLLIEELASERPVDASRSLIFVMGNLDEAYTMSSDMSLDITADEFHRASLKIKVPQIREALQSRLRNEQISRLGNIHIIYPAFSTESFRILIGRELEKIADTYQREQDLKLIFDPSVHELIYREGVVPSQGVRPLFSTVRNIIEARIGDVMVDFFRRRKTADELRYRTDGAEIFVTGYADGVETGVMSYFPELKVRELKRSRNDDIQAMCAVHEAGHALCFSLLMGRVPRSVHSVSATGNMTGVTIVGDIPGLLTRQGIVQYMASGLGGYAAEKQIFGDAGRSTGSEDDIARVTSMAARALRTGAFADIPVAWQTAAPETAAFAHEYDTANTMGIQDLVREALTMAESCLLRNRDLLLEVADGLSDEPMMSGFHLKNLIDRYAVDTVPAASIPEYRELLKNASAKRTEDKGSA